MVPLKMGMIGGGLDALVGAWHRRAVAIDGGIELVAGALNFPTAEDGVRRPAFSAGVIDGDASDAKWTATKKYFSASADK